ncbi:MAG: glycosyltransferase [Roseburia sp.]|nr:glycosyltransferase [Roseburia sp.]
MIKIGFVDFDMSIRGGAQQVLCNIVNALAEEPSGEREYEIYVISLIHEKGKCAYELAEGIHYHNILPYKARIREVIMKAGKDFRKYCMENEIGFLFYVGVYAGFMGGILGKRLDIPKVFCDHGALMNQWDDHVVRFMRRMGVRYSDRTVVLTKQSEKAYYEKFHYEPGRVMTIYNWIDDAIFSHAGAYDADSRRLLTAGRFSKEKGMDLLVDTAVQLKEKTTEFVWEVYGEGELFEEIRQRIHEEGLEKNVKLMGLANGMETCYQGHCMYVLTSYREGLPLTLLEAKANHLPLVSFDIVSGPAEIIEDGRDGVLVPPYDTEGMAEKIYELLINSEKRVRMSEQSSWNLDEFKKEKILNQWKALIGEMTSQETS